jgi:hypothetical protein
MQFDNTISKAMQDLSSVLSALNMIHTLEMQQHLREARAFDASLHQQLQQAHQRDLQALQAQLEDLIGGQDELKLQLAAATKEQREEWDAVVASLGQLSGDVGVIREGVGVVREDVGVIRVDVEVIMGDVMELKAAVHAWMEGRMQAQASSSGQLVRSRLILDRERVQWHDGDVLDSGAFADVYAGTFNDHDVAVKLLRWSASEQQREQVGTARDLAKLDELTASCCKYITTKAITDACVVVCTDFLRRGLNSTAFI